jgi:hypothetical protein
LKVIERDIELAFVASADTERVVGFRVELEALFENQVLKTLFRFDDFVLLFALSVHAKQKILTFQVLIKGAFGKKTVGCELSFLNRLRKIAALHIELRQL